MISFEEKKNPSFYYGNTMISNGENMWKNEISYFNAF